MHLAASLQWRMQRRSCLSRMVSALEAEGIYMQVPNPCFCIGEEKGLREEVGSPARHPGRPKVGQTSQPLQAGFAWQHRVNRCCGPCASAPLHAAQGRRLMVQLRVPAQGARAARCQECDFPPRPTSCAAHTPAAPARSSMSTDACHTRAFPPILPSQGPDGRRAHGYDEAAVISMQHTVHVLENFLFVLSKQI